MTDSTDQIARVFEHWGGNPHREFGISPQEQAEKHKSKRLPFMPPCQVAPLNPYLHEDLWHLSHEVATSLNATQPRLYRIVDYTKDLIMPIGYYPPDRVFLDMELCQWLEREELQGLLAHEMRHSQQSTLTMLVRRNIGLVSHELAEADDGWIGSLAAKVAGHCVRQAGNMECDADDAGALLVGNAVMQRAILKLAVFIVMKIHPEATVDLSGTDTLRQCLTDFPETYHRFKSWLYAGISVADRIARLDQSVIEQASAEMNELLLLSKPSIIL